MFPITQPLLRGESRLRLVCLSLCLLALAACGGGGGGGAEDVGGGGATPAPLPPVATIGTRLQISSDVGEHIGAGGSYSYTQANARIAVEVEGNRLMVSVAGDEIWSGGFQLPAGQDRWVAGSYAGLPAWPTQDAALGGLAWRGEGRDCQTLQSTLNVLSVSYDSGALSAIELRFEQRCGGSSAALRGHLVWRADDTTRPPGPINPAPATLWRASPAEVPASGNYLLLQSEPGDWVGEGRSHAYTDENAFMDALLVGRRVILGVSGAQTWRGDFLGMDHLPNLEPGYYGNLQRFPFNNPVRGGLSFEGEGRGCGRVSGWFVIDRLEVWGEQLQSIELRFEQRCDGQTGVLRGQLRWTDPERTEPPDPQQPPSSQLWRPAAAIIPATGNFVLLDSRPGDYVGGGRRFLYTQVDAELIPSSDGSDFRIQVRGFEHWTGSFAPMPGQAQLEVGHYPDTTSHGDFGPRLDWSGEGRSCNTSRGWFVIDEISRRNGGIESIELRFEIYCGDSLRPLRGMVRWSVADNTVPPGPAVPPPAELWQPPAGSTPASGSYVYLDSVPGDWVGAGQTHLYTRANALLDISVSPTELVVSVMGDQGWGAIFEPMSTQTSLQPGYYPNLGRPPLHNPVEGAFHWSGEGRGCNRLVAWVVIDEIEVVEGVLQSLTLRFQQNCDGLATPLYGKVHWSADDRTSPPGPQQPPPPGLWQPPVGSTPAEGDFVFLQSMGAADWIGLGRTWLYTEPGFVQLLGREGGLAVTVGGAWQGEFQGMVGNARLQKGYYGSLMRYGSNQNPVRGGLSWSGDARVCNRLQGWFAVDDIVYDGDTVTGVDLRFEQFCDGSPVPLRGRVRWGMDAAQGGG